MTIYRKFKDDNQIIGEKKRYVIENNKKFKIWEEHSQDNLTIEVQETCVEIISLMWYKD